jgi:hypothetical protein
LWLVQGVVTSVLSLMQGIVNDYSDEYEDSVPKAVDRLRGVCPLRRRLRCPHRMLEP